LENVWKGYNSTLFAYGETGCGKCYSMTGCLSKESDKGIIPRYVSLIFENVVFIVRGCAEMFSRITNEKDSNVTYDVKVSYIDIMRNRKICWLLKRKKVLI
jgi:hypothetical protein